MVPLAGAVLLLRHGNGSGQSCRSRRTWHSSNWGFPGTWEILSSPPASSAYGGGRAKHSRSTAIAILGGGSEAQDAARGIAKRRQRSAARGAQGVGQRHSTVAAGELASEDPVKGRALHTGGPGKGHQGSPPWLHFLSP